MVADLHVAVADPRVITVCCRLDALSGEGLAHLAVRWWGGPGEGQAEVDRLRSHGSLLSGAGAGYFTAWR
jgi:hypothetical protein